MDKTERTNIHPHIYAQKKANLNTVLKVVKM